MNKSRTNCSVIGCHTRKGREVTASFHKFPQISSRVTIINKSGREEVVDRRKAWVMACRFEKNISSSLCVCSRHFLPTDYLFHDQNRKKRQLKRTAIPSLNLPESDLCLSPKKRRPRGSAGRPARRGKQKQPIEIASEFNSVDNSDTNDPEEVILGPEDMKIAQVQITDQNRKRRQLKMTAVPSLNLPESDLCPSPKKRWPRGSAKPPARRGKQKQLIEIAPESDSVDNSDTNDPEEVILGPEDLKIVDVLLGLRQGTTLDK